MSLQSMRNSRQTLQKEMTTQSPSKRLNTPLTLALISGGVCIVSLVFALRYGRFSNSSGIAPLPAPSPVAASSVQSAPATPTTFALPIPQNGAGFGGASGMASPTLNPLAALSPSGSTSGASGSASPSNLDAMRMQLERNPRNAALRVQLAALLSIQGRDSEAEDCLRTALQHQQRLPEIYHALGMLYLHNNQYLPAAQAFETETGLRPKDYLAHLKLATADAYLAKGDAARHEFETARRLKPAEPDPYLGLAMMNNSSERYPFAVRYLNDYIQRAPQPGQGYALLSRVYLNMKLYEQAVVAGRTAAAQMPSNPNVWYTLGQACCYRPGDANLTEAAQAFERAAALTPNDGHTHFELGHTYTRLSRPADAIAQYREAVRCEPYSGKSRYQLGQLLMQQGQTEEGRQILQQAQSLIALNQRESQLQEKITATPNNPQNLFTLANLYRQMGRYDEARPWYEAVLRLAPNYPQAREKLVEMQRGQASSRH